MPRAPRAGRFSQVKDVAAISRSSPTHNRHSAARRGGGVKGRRAGSHAAVASG